MQAKIIDEEMLILTYECIEGVHCVMVECSGYEHFVALPNVIEYQSNRLGKTGWNSDTHRAHYQSNAMRAKILLPSEIAKLKGYERVRAENEYADRHEFSSRD